MPRHVVAIFLDRAKAEAAIDELWHEGFDKNHIGMAAPGQRLQKGTTATEGAEDTAADGAVGGAAFGTAVGAAAGALATVALPGLGAILVGGMWMGMALGGAAGAALGTFAGPFVAMGFSKETAAHYETQVRGGRTLVVVSPDADTAKAILILKKHGPTELWSESGRQVF